MENRKSKLKYEFKKNKKSYYFSFKQVRSKNNITNDMNFFKKKNIASILKAQSKAAMNIFESKNIPFRQFVFRKKEEEELGKVFTFFVLETILLARLLNLNAFDQPAVEQVKIETQKILSV